jgi:selenocysteine lyase/cysteine desulfurase
VAGAIDWQPGDTVVYTDVEHPAGVLPWRRLADVRDIDVAVVEGERGHFTPADFVDAVSDARLVCLSAVSWNYGTRLPIEEVVELAHEADAMVLVDAVQAVGQLPVDVTEWGADCVATSAHKWPLGPWGSGVL